MPQLPPRELQPHEQEAQKFQALQHRSTDVEPLPEEVDALSPPLQAFELLQAEPEEPFTRLKTFQQPALGFKSFLRHAVALQRPKVQLRWTEPHPEVLPELPHPTVVPPEQARPHLLTRVPKWKRIYHARKPIDREWHGHFNFHTEYFIEDNYSCHRRDDAASRGQRY